MPALKNNLLLVEDDVELRTLIDCYPQPVGI